MKRLVFLLCLLLSLALHAQKTYTVNGESLELKTEVDGEIKLLWNIFDGNYRYFAEKNGQISELTNTRGSDNKFQEEYKTVLSDLTDGSGLSADRVKLTLFSLREFLDSYNKQADPNYNQQSTRASIETRVLIFGGITNQPFVENPNNSKNAQVGLEIELVGKGIAPRHALIFQFKHSPESDGFKFQSTQIGLGYRFRFINQDAFNIYANVVGATYTFTKSEELFDDMVVERDGDSFDAPFYFGLGADVKISDSIFVSILYDELFGLFIDNQGNFSTNLSAGIKFVL